MHPPQNKSISLHKYFWVMFPIDKEIIAKMANNTLNFNASSIIIRSPTTKNTPKNPIIKLIHCIKFIFSPIFKGAIMETINGCNATISDKRAGLIP